jgi:hypothetical protein
MMDDSDDSCDSSAILSTCADDGGVAVATLPPATNNDEGDDANESDGSFSFALSPTESEIRVMLELELGGTEQL